MTWPVEHCWCGQPATKYMEGGWDRQNNCPVRGDPCCDECYEEEHTCAVCGRWVNNWPCDCGRAAAT